MIRSIVPTDMLRLSLQDGSLSNYAKRRDELFITKETRISLAVNLLSLWVSRGTQKIWIATDKTEVGGLISPRNRYGSNAWEIDHLLLSEANSHSCFGLLKILSIIGGEQGITKLFLRLCSNSSLVDAAKSEGFSCYLSEHLYQWDQEQDKSNGQRSQPTWSCIRRHKETSDEYGLYGIYRDCAPQALQIIEGVNFKEWQGMKIKDEGRNWKTEWVYEKQGNLVGWVRIKREANTGQFEAMVAPEGDSEHLLSYTIKSLSGCNQIHCLVPEYQNSLRNILEDYGFCQVDEYSDMVKELAVRADNPYLAPQQA